MPPIPARAVERITASIARDEPDQIATALTENHFEQMYAESGENDECGLPDPGPVPDEAAPRARLHR